MVVPHVVSKYAVSQEDEFPAPSGNQTENASHQAVRKVMARLNVFMFSVVIILIVFLFIFVYQSRWGLLDDEASKFEAFLKKEEGRMSKFDRPRKLSNFHPRPNKTYRDLPDQKDWRESGVVSPVKTQGDCNAGWAFAVASAVESQYAMENGNILELSAQELVDCDRWNKGCVESAASTESAAMYAMEQGLETADDYPYIGNATGKCLSQKDKKRVKVRREILLPNEEDTIVEWVAFSGPVTFEMRITDEFYNYKSGIFNPDDCKTGPRHSMVIVGYGEEGDQAYWIVKNSFGTDWGEDGYMKLAMGGNVCGMMDYVLTYEL